MLAASLALVFCSTAPSSPPKTPTPPPSKGADTPAAKPDAFASARKTLDETLAKYRKFVDETGPAVLALIDAAKEKAKQNPAFDADGLLSRLAALDQAREDFVTEGKWPANTDPKIGTFSQTWNELREEVRGVYKTTRRAAIVAGDTVAGAQLDEDLATFNALRDIAPWHSVRDRAVVVPENSGWHITGDGTIRSPDPTGEGGAQLVPLEFTQRFPLEYELRIMLRRDAGGGLVDLVLPWSRENTFVVRVDLGPAPRVENGKTQADAHTLAIVVHADECAVKLDARAPQTWRAGSAFPWRERSSGEGARMLSLSLIDAATHVWIDDVQLKCLVRSRAK